MRCTGPAQQLAEGTWLVLMAPLKCQAIRCDGRNAQAGQGPWSVKVVALPKFNNGMI